MNKKNVLVMVLAMLLVAMISVGGTIAWLTAESDAVTNTFAVGDIVIDLDEAKVGTDNKALTGDNAERVKENKYTIIPGERIDKDPIVTVKSGSEKCYVYVLVKNSVMLDDKTIVATWTVDNKWAKVGEKTDDEDGTQMTLYKYDTIVDATTTEVKTTAVFSEVLIDGTNVTTETMNQITEENDKIVVTAYAHQSENTTEAVANAAAISWAGVNAVTAGN